MSNSSHILQVSECGAMILMQNQLVVVPKMMLIAAKVGGIQILFHPLQLIIYATSRFGCPLRLGKFPRYTCSRIVGKITTNYGTVTCRIIRRCQEKERSVHMMTVALMSKKMVLLLLVTSINLSKAYGLEKTSISLGTCFYNRALIL